MREAPSDAVLAEVVHAVAEVLGLREDEIGIETRAADLEAWDSFGHVRIVLAVEQAFGIEMSMADIETADSVSRLCAIVEAASSRAPSIVAGP